MGHRLPHLWSSKSSFRQSCRGRCWGRQDLGLSNNKLGLARLGRTRMTTGTSGRSLGVRVLQSGWLKHWCPLCLEEQRALVSQTPKWGGGEAPPHSALAVPGVAAVAGAFTEQLLKDMAAFNERPIVFALSNPTSKAECTAEQCYRITQVGSTELWLYPKHHSVLANKGQPA